MRLEKSDPFGIPAEIEISLTRSLYSEAPSALVGCIGTTAAAITTALLTQSLFVTGTAVAMVIVAALRVLDGVRIVGQPLDTLERARAAERTYTSLAGLYALLLGVWCLAVLVAAPENASAQLLAVGMTLANMVGVTARNFGSRRLVRLQLVGVGVPLVVGLVATGEPAYWFVAAVLTTFFMRFDSIAANLRRILVGATTAELDARAQSERFDTALDTMAHGLVMIDADGRAMIVNRRLADIVGCSHAVRPVAASGRAVDHPSASSLLRACVRARLVSTGEALKVLRAAAWMRSGGVGAPVLVRLADDRVLSLTFRHRSVEVGGRTGGPALVAIVEDVTERENATERMRWLARFDSLTGLANRNCLRTLIQSALLDETAGGASCAVLYIDLDGFKAVNDALGHGIGDRVLREVAIRITARVGPMDTVARVGGDEFVILLERSPGDAALEAMASDLVAALGRAYDIEETVVSIGASIGIAVAPRDGRTVEALLSHADIALFTAKSGGGGSWRRFDEGLAKAAHERRLLEADLRRAVERDELLVHYQPIVSPRDGRIHAFEALLRWPHPERGLVSPARFVPIAEDTGLIGVIGRRVLGAACAEAMRWPQDVRVSVNVSPAQFRASDIVADVRAALRATGLAPERLDLEITESILLDDERALDALEALRRVGVGLCLDDFGTGFSSLGYLRRLPLSKVKIDRAFVTDLGRDPRSQMLLHDVAQLCANLGMTVVVEGVETRTQLDAVLAEEAIGLVQGWYFGRPAGPETARALLEGHPRLGAVVQLPRRAFG